MQRKKHGFDHVINSISYFHFDFRCHSPAVSWWRMRLSFSTRLWPSASWTSLRCSCERNSRTCVSIWRNSVTVCGDRSLSRATSSSRHFAFRRRGRKRTRSESIREMARRWRLDFAENNVNQPMNQKVESSSWKSPSLTFDELYER